MATIREVFRLVENFTQSQEKIMNDCVNNSSEMILDANRDQLFAGKDKQGKEIIPEYKKRTIKIKKKKKQPYDRVTLKDTGDFYKEMFLKIESGKIFIDSKDEKTAELMIKYNKTDTVLGIPNNKKETINESIMDKFINIFRLMTKL